MDSASPVTTSPEEERDSDIANGPASDERSRAPAPHLATRGKLSSYGLLLHVGEQTLETRYGKFQAHVFRNLHTRTHALAVCRGDIQTSKTLLARVHSACITSETFGACDCDCAEQLDLALACIAEAERGVVFYLMQEGRGAGYAAKARDRMIVQSSGHTVTTFDAYKKLGLDPDYRRYSEVALSLRLLGVSAPLRLLTNNPEKLRALEEHGVAVASAERIQSEASPFNVHYLSTKRGVGHALAGSSLDERGAELPEPVHSFEPTPLEGAPYLVKMASYLLPLRVGGSGAFAWFRAHVYFDLLAGCERVVLTHGEAARGERPAPLVRIQHESLFERFPVQNGVNKRQWRTTVVEMVRHGHGVAVFPSADGHDDLLVASVLGARPRRERALAGRIADEALFVLLEHHVPGKVLTPVVTSLDDPACSRVVSEELDRHGFSLGTSTLLDLSA